MMIQERKRDTDTAISPTIGVVLMVAITVVIAAVVATTALGIGSGTGDTTQADIDARMTEDSTYFTGASDIVLTHNSGDEIPVSDVELQMSMPDGEVTVTNLPVNATALPCPTNDEINEEHAVGADGFLRGGACWNGKFAENPGDDEKTWAPGDRAVLFVRALKQSDASPSMEFGDTVEVTVVDEGTESVVGTAEFTVGE